MNVHVIVAVGLVVIYVALFAYVAIRARAAREYIEFSLARRELPVALIFASLAATYVGPGFSIGFVGRGFKSGVLFLCIGLAYSAQNILVGLFVAPRLRALRNCQTLGDAIGLKYGRPCHVLAGFISVSVCTFFAAVMVHGGKVILHDMLNLPGWPAVLVIVGSAALYTTSGGLRASVMTDAFQFVAFAILLPMTLLVALAFHFRGGAGALTQQAMEATRLGLGGGNTWLHIAGFFVAFLLGETLIPPYANRALASKTAGASRNSFVLAGLFSVIWFAIMIALGVVARTVVPQTTDEDRVLLTFVRSIMSIEGQAVLLVGLVSIVLSSLDSLLNAGAVVFTQDVIKPLASTTDRTALVVGRGATVGIAAVAAALTPIVPSIVGGLLACYTIWASAVLPALILGLWVRRPRPLAGMLSMGIGTILSIAAVTVLLLQHRNVEEASVVIVPALLVSVLVYVVGHSLGKAGPSMDSRAPITCVSHQ
jgi:SSS family solute:Na+ symporter